MANKRAVFFCSSSNCIDPKYNQAARQIVRAACLQGYEIVSGGTIKGTMDVVSDEAAKCGAKVIGVIPRFMQGLEHPALSECIWTDKMSERKDLMREGASLAIALPGGIGTLDELAETFCLAKLGLFSGKIIVFNLDGFYDAFRDQLGIFVDSNMQDKRSLELISFPSSVEELIELL